MSWRHTLAAGELVLPGKASAKSVLLALGHHANEYTGICWPSLERLVLFTGLTRRSVQDQLRFLEREGLIETVHGTGRKSSSYTLKLPGADPIEQAPGKSRGANDDMRGANDTARGAAPAPKSSRNNHKEQDARGGPPRLPLPADWTPTDADLDWSTAAAAQGVDITHETALFKTNAGKTGETYANPSAAWRHWITRAIGFAKRDAQRPQGRGRSAADGAARLRNAAHAARE